MSGTVTGFDLTGPLPGHRLAIEASAGTGKTYTLAGLAVRYVAEAGVDVSELLVVTFTRAAAAELRDRIRSRLARAAAVLRDGDLAAIDDDSVIAFLAREDRAGRAARLEAAVTDFDAATITTIHGFAQQVLVTLGASAPTNPDATLVDDALDLVTQVSADVLAAVSVSEPARAGELPKLPTLVKLALVALGNPGIAIVPSDAGEPADGIDEAGQVGGRVHRLVDRVVDEVHHRRRVAGTTSFDDLLTHLRDALATSPSAAAGLRARYRVALVDEFQDTDPVQWEIFSSLFGGEDGSTTLVLVGDPKQAIYGFRGANVHTYLQAVEAPGTEHATLGVNWRSDQSLLDGLEPMLTGATFGDSRIGFIETGAAPVHRSQRLRDGDGAALAALEVRGALDPELARNKTGDKSIKVPDAWRCICHDLAVHVQGLLASAHLPGPADGPDHPLRPGDVAVLVRTHEEAGQVQATLRRQGIPAVAHRGASVLESAAALQWRWLLEALIRPSDRGRARTAALSWFFGWSAARLDAADDDLAAVHDQLYGWAGVLETYGVVEFWARLQAESGVTTRVLAAPDGDRNLTDLNHLAELLQAGATGHRPGPAGLVAALGLLDEASRIDPENDVTARRIESEADNVQVMTVHAAKGLEFPVVLLPTLWRYSAPTECIFQDPDTGVRTFDVTNGRAWPDRAAGEVRKQLAKREALGESLRLAYVALTRARHRTTVWWTRGSNSNQTGLARLLFGRDDAGALDPALVAGDAVSLPDDGLALLRLKLLFEPAGDAVTVASVPAEPARLAPWVDPEEPPAGPGELAVATLGRELARPLRRWSFSAISDRARTPDLDLDPHLDPADDTLGDAGAADEPPVADEVLEPAGGASELPLGAIPGGTAFGSLVHDLLEHVDFAAPDLPAALVAAIEDRRRWDPARALGDELAAGLQAAIETPLGPLFDGRCLRDFGRADWLDELTFELRLGDGGHVATDRELGALVGTHLAADDPLRGWADQLAAGCFDVELAGHLTGSIDAVFRLRDPHDPAAPGRFVLADYKTNVLGAPGTPLRAADYHPDRLPAAMEEHHYPLQALLYAVVLHRYLRWRLRDSYDPAVHFGGAAYLFLRGLTGPDTPTIDGRPHGVFGWRIPPALVSDLSDLLDGRLVPAGLGAGIS